LLVGELDVAPDGISADILGPAVGGLHDAGPAAGHDRESRPRELGADFAGQLVIAVIFSESGGAEDGGAGADEMQSAKSPDELRENLDRHRQFKTSRLRSLKEFDDLFGTGAGAPVG